MIHAPSEPAAIQWDSQGQPRSDLFDDVYFSSASGLEETRHVFLHHNQLAERWRRLRSGQHFTIAETGFGTGLNFLAAWQLWQDTAPADAHLHFISVEKFPLTRRDLAQALALWPTIAPLAEQLIDQYPPPDCRGFHRLHFGQIQLTLIFDDAHRGLGALLPSAAKGPKSVLAKGHWSPYYDPSGTVDAWFLDGFAPSKNPDLWNEALFQLMFSLSRSGTTFATFTVAGTVRRGLRSAGFTAEKVAGFGRKREMLRGCLEQLVTTSQTEPPKKPKPDASWHLVAHQEPATDQNKLVIVIGAGLAGCHTARALAQKGFQVIVVEQNQVASGASGNPQGVLYSKLSHGDGALAHFNRASFTHAYRFYQHQTFFAHCGQACGVLQVGPPNPAIAAQFRHSPEFVTALSAEQASEIAGVPLQHGGLWLSQAGWLDPVAVCQRLLIHPNIKVITGRKVHQLRQLGPSWQLLDEHRTVIATATKVVVACAHSAGEFEQCNPLPGKAIRGQISFAQADKRSQNLRTVLCGQGYIAPAHRQQHCIGATFNLADPNPLLSWHDHRLNLQHAYDFSTDFSDLEVSALEQGRVSYRCTTPDYLPIVGPVPEATVMLERFAAYRFNYKKTIDAVGAFHPGLFINIGHGSKGLTYTPLCSEFLACMIAGQPLPLPRELALHLHPARFLIRDLSRKRV